MLGGDIGSHSPLSTLLYRHAATRIRVCQGNRSCPFSL